MIVFDKVSKIYSDESVALDNVSFPVEQGEFISIVGHSGAGKTTLLKLLLAEDVPTSGSVFFDSTNVHALRKRGLHNLRRRIGTIFKDFRLLPGKNAYENIDFAMEAVGKTDEEIAANVPEVLSLVGLEKKFWNFPSELSGGETAFGYRSGNY